MSFNKWLGLGAGWVLGGPIGGIIGLAIGSLIDMNKTSKSRSSQGAYRNQEAYRSQGGYSNSGNTTPVDFAMSLMVLIAAVMKADNKLLKSELDYVKNYLSNTYGQENSRELVLILRDILKRDIPVTDVCFQIKRNLDYSSRLQLLYLLYGIAQADGMVDISEINLIDRIAASLGVSPNDNASIKSTYYNDIESAYKVLEISSATSDEEVKKAYKKMAVKYHPDKVSYLGEEMQKNANEKFKKVNEAFEKIKKERGMK